MEIQQHKSALKLYKRVACLTDDTCLVKQSREAIALAEMRN